ncbi:TPA: NUDIX hydrolase [Candidatus Woesearchaeota archaeon]|nr:NUDIX hydrolase [Candidatus Woesearchaeota archaeon]HIH54921.1 NUDIX hydrolase [Candidatus Woesearchaeota archaeon]HIJ01788.1 NUDIX hydrolase [Candidatus Woesearchaeota archaeon]HIJ14039.1 NUDIX hydrolase [Candidatus Woesearchaeota archaeon]
MAIKVLSGCAIIHYDNILLLYRIKHDYYELPGGKVKDNEALEHAAIRETKEEINVDVKITRNLGCFEFSKKDELIQSNIFEAEIMNGEIKIMEEVFSEFIWMPIKEYYKYKLAPNVEWLCKELCKNELNK